MTPAELSSQITGFVTQRIEAIVRRFMPDFVIPGFFCGHRRPGFSEGPDLIYTLAHLHALGVKTIADVPIEKAISELLRGVDGPATDTFYSYRVAEALLAFGGFENNPLLADFTPAERENIRLATDSSRIFGRETQTIPKYPPNYWAVLARCEFTRKQLGILEDDTILKKSIAQLENLLFSNPLGFFDDDRHGRGRYDIYTADVQLFCEPMWHLLDAGKLQRNLVNHTRLLEKFAMENGASFTFGRSIGALSVCLTMELAAMSLERGLAVDPARSLGLIAHAFHAFEGWFEDDLINAHRHGDTDGYRGIHRVLQMTIDCLGKLCYVAEKLIHADPTASSATAALFPAVDEFIPLDERNGGVWMYRNGHLAFQLPLIDGYNADYAPWPRSTGLLENPVSSPLFCGIPRIAAGGVEYAPLGLPAHVEKRAGGITITHDGFKCVSNGEEWKSLAGKRTATCRVEDDTIFLEEHLVFEKEPAAVSYYIPETERPLRVVVASEQAFHQDTISVGGMADWRSCWGELKNAHQIHLTPAREMRVSFEITPRLRVLPIPSDHDYARALYEGMTGGFVVKRPRPECGMNAKILAAGTDIFHIGWPEHCFGTPAKNVEKFDAEYSNFIGDMAKSGVQLVWTMHNRRPHHWDAERGRSLYREWARVVDGVIHHSEWGMKLMRSELPFREDAKHVVIPHGHFGEQMRVTRTRPEIEASIGLKPCAMRFGVLGRYQKEKQIEMIIAAFREAARPDQQLVLTAYNADLEKPDDPRIIFLPRNDWMTREEIAENTHLCDALVSAHTGDTYLTSGISADAVGVGIGMFVPHWEFFHETLGEAPFYYDDTQESLATRFASVTPADIEHGKAAFTAMQPIYAWPRLAAMTLAFYRSLGRK